MKYRVCNSNKSVYRVSNYKGFHGKTERINIHTVKNDELKFEKLSSISDLTSAKPFHTYKPCLFL